MPPAYDAAYYRREIGVDEMRRFSTHWWAARYYALVSRRVLRRSGGRRVLDIGCAHGWTLAWLEDEFETYGVDLSEYAIGRAREIASRSQLRVHDVTAGLPADLPALDLVLMKYVLEHLPDPGATLRQVAAGIAPGGALLFAVPNTASPGRRMKGPQWFAALDPTHCSLLAPDEWTRLARAAGLIVERTWGDGLWDAPYVRGVPRLLQHAVFAGPTIAEVLVGGRFLPARWGENLLVLARKPRAGAAQAAP
ncbi:MAG TPA: class I SAM-dependent methyltransferase [Gaiellaceae bacterium]|nr:class I SAM-dependent methyltransferase [Gaiellaceae bacterium]